MTAALLSLALVAAPGPPSSNSGGQEDATPLAEFNFDEGDGGFTSVSQSGGLSQWTWESMQGAPAEVGAGLADAPLADGAWATWLPLSDADYYLVGWAIHLVSPLVTIPAEGASVELWHFYDTQPGGDGGQVGFRRGALEAPVEPLVPAGGYPSSVLIGGTPAMAFSGQSGGWGVSWFDLGAGVGGQAALDLFFTSNYSQEEEAALGWLVERVTVWPGDRVPPQLQVEAAPGDTDVFTEGYPLEVTCRDRSGVAGVVAYWSATRDGETTSNSTPLTLGGEDRWRGELPAQLPGTTVTWFVVGADSVGNQMADPARALEDVGERRRFRVELRPPAGLVVDPAVERVASSLTLRWSAPETDLPVVAYELFETFDPSVAPEEGSRWEVSGGVLLSTRQLEADPDDFGVRYYAVRAGYDGLEGERWWSQVTPWLPVAVEVPSLTSVEPAAAYQGQSLRVDIYGEHTDFAAGHVTVTVGSAGVTVQAVDVLDLHHIQALLAVAPDAPVEELTLRALVDGQDRGSLPFEIRPGDERPVITQVVPSWAAQGSTTQVTIQGRAIDFSRDLPSVDFGVGVKTLSVAATRGGEALVATIEVEPWAPLGERTVLLSGQESFYSFPFRIEPTGALITTCQTGPGPGAGLWWLLLAAALGHRPRR